MALKPLFARVLLERPRMVSGSGRIIIPESAQKVNAPTRGVVIACGPSCDPGIQPGQTVLFGRHAGDWIKDGAGNEIYICQDEDILAIEEAA